MYEYMNILWHLLAANQYGGRTGSIFSCSKGLWDSGLSTNHNKASVRVLVSLPITAYVGHIRWHLPVDITCGG